VDYGDDPYVEERAAWNPWWAEVAWMAGVGAFIAVTVAAGLFSR
jgi:hypothetical protein